MAPRPATPWTWSGTTAPPPAGPRPLSPWGRPYPPLDHTVAGILKSVQRTGLVGSLALRPLPETLAAE
jgi:hypothetical protein